MWMNEKYTNSVKKRNIGHEYSLSYNPVTGNTLYACRGENGKTISIIKKVYFAREIENVR